MKGALLLGLALLLAIAGIGATGLQDGTTLEGPMVIPPGREGQVERLLKPLSKGWRGLRHAGTQLQRAEIRVLLQDAGERAAPDVKCPGPGWVKPPGALVISRPTRPLAPPGPGHPGQGRVTRGELSLAWFLCAGAGEGVADPRPMAAALLEAIGRRHRGDIWQHRLADRRGRVDVGVLTPLSHWLGVEPTRAAFLSWGLGLLAALSLAMALRRRPPPPDSSGPPPSRRARVATCLAMGLLLVLGVALRVHHATHLPLDADEVWALPGRTPVFNNDHDAWVHPPLHRAVQRAHVQAAGWTEGDPLLGLRVPSIMAGALALIFLALGLLQGSRSWWVVVPFAVAACSPGIARESALARPYALAALLVVLGAYALCVRPAGRGSSRLEERLRWAVGLLAFGLAAWTDYLAGMAAGLLLLLALLPGQLALSMAPRMRPLALLAAAAPVVALAPGALEAIRGQVHPAAPGPVASAHGTPGRSQPRAASGPDLRPRGGPARGERAGAAASIFGFGLLGQDGPGWPAPVLGALALAIFVLSSIWSRSLLGLAPLLVVLLLLFTSCFVALRPRNMLFMPYLAALVFGLLLPGAGGQARGLTRRMMDRFLGGSRG